MSDISLLLTDCGLERLRGEPRAFSRLLLSVFAAIYSTEPCGTNAWGGNRIFSAWMTVYKRCQVVVQCELYNRYLLKGGAKWETKGGRMERIIAATNEENTDADT